MKKDIYKIKNTIDKLNSNINSLFINQSELKNITYKLKSSEYNIYYPYKECDKVILYKKEIPNISLYKIKSFNKLRHQDILGSILSLNINEKYLGDIVIDNDNYYFYIISNMDDYIKENLKTISSYKVEIEKIDIDYLKDYERKYEEINIIVPSLRIDSVISRLIKTNRDNVHNKIDNREVILNYEVLAKNSYILKENDVFSIRKYGKYRFIKINNTTKKGNIVILIKKYI